MKAPFETPRGALATRLVPAVLFLLAVGYALAARRYVVEFVADPLGPRAAPWLLSALLALFAALLLVRPGAPPAWPDGRAARRIGAAVACLVAYALLLAPLGFVLSTTLFIAALARIADGPALRGAVAGLAFSAALYYLFVFALELQLPIGRIFPFLGG